MSDYVHEARSATQPECENRGDKAPSAIQPILATR